MQEFNLDTHYVVGRRAAWLLFACPPALSRELILVG